MQVRVALTETGPHERGADAFVIAWPVDNDPAHANAGAARAIQRELGGLPTVVVALTGTGDLCSYGRIEHVLAVTGAGLDGHRRVSFDIDLPGGTPVTRLRSRRPSPPKRLAA